MDLQKEVKLCDPEIVRASCPTSSTRHESIVNESPISLAIFEFKAIYLLLHYAGW